MKSISTFVLLVLAGLLSAPSCRSAEPTLASRNGALPAVPPVKVRTARVEGGSGSWIEVPGTVEAAKAADLASRVSALVESVSVEEGAFVRAGDTLLKLDGRDVQARLAAALVNLEAASAHRERVRALRAKDAATEQESEEADASFSAAEADRDALRAQMAYVELRAPFDGWITRKWTRPGDLAVPGQPLLSIQGTGLLRVAATVTKAQTNRLKRGQPLEAILDGEAPVMTRISVLAPAGDPSSLRFILKSDLPADSGARAGSFARLRLPRGEDTPALLVPRTAVVERGALTGVFVVEDGRARLRWISLAEDAGEFAVVRSGLFAGDEIIVRPRGLVDGSPVERIP